MNEGFAEKVERQARLELAAEAARAAIEAKKQELRAAKANRKWWHRLVPFVIRIERRK